MFQYKYKIYEINCLSSRSLLSLVHIYILKIMTIKYSKLYEFNIKLYIYIVFNLILNLNVIINILSVYVIFIYI